MQRVNTAMTSLVLLGVSALVSSTAFARASTNLPAKPEHCFEYTNEINEDVPWSIHIIKVDRSRHDFEFCTTLGRGDVLGMGTVSAQIKAMRPGCGEPLAAINGDFYEKSEKHEGRPRDLQIRFGEVVSSPAGHSCFWIAPDGTPWMTNVVSGFRVVWPDTNSTPIGLNQIRGDAAAVLYTQVFGSSTRTSGGVELLLEPEPGSPWLPLQVGKVCVGRVRAVLTTGNTHLTPGTMVLSLGPKLPGHQSVPRPGDTLRILTATTPDLTGVQMAIGGGPALVRDGKAMQWGGFVKLRHPRTALGWNKTHFFLVEVDGRQSNLSVGMTFPELASYLIKLGCEQAMNLDGGGSATLWALGEVRNSPSEGEERAAPNALVLVKKPLRKP